MINSTFLDKILSLLSKRCVWGRGMGGYSISKWEYCRITDLILIKSLFLSPDRRTYSLFIPVIIFIDHNARFINIDVFVRSRRFWNSAPLSDLREPIFSLFRYVAKSADDTFQSFHEEDAWSTVAKGNISSDKWNNITQRQQKKCKHDQAHHA